MPWGHVRLAFPSRNSAPTGLQVWGCYPQRVQGRALALLQTRSTPGLAAPQCAGAPPLAALPELNRNASGTMQNASVAVAVNTSM